jgi:hypothetical protein
MEPIAMRQLYVEQSSGILADEDEPAEQIVNEMRALHRAYCKVYDEWFAMTDRRGSSGRPRNWVDEVQ